jgi:amino-acid N-acetyltransferase
MRDDLKSVMSAPSCAADGSCCGPWSACCDEYDPDYVFSFTIENAVPSNAGDVRRLLASNDLPLDGVKDSMEDFIIARAAGRVVGCIGLERYGAQGLLRSAAVRKDLQGRGIGRALTDRLFELASSRGVETLYLLTTTADDYFARLGFQRIDRAQIPVEMNESAELRGACPASAVVMSRELD